MAFQPGLPGSQFPSEDWMVRELKELRQQIQQLAAANPFAPMGMTPAPGGIIVNGSETVNGALTVNGTANFTGNTTIGGTAAVTGDITKSNSWGASSLGPVVFGTGSPSLTFTKAGTSYLPSGIGLTQNGAGTLDQITVFGPNATSRAFLVLKSDKSFALASDSDAAGPSIAGNSGANGDLNLFGGSTNGSVKLSSYGTGNVQVYGNFAVTGSKAFVMDHPQHPDTMTLMHCATESPVNGVEYWGTATVGSVGSVTVKLPGYFESLTKVGGRNIQLTPTAGCDTTPWVSRITDGAFTIHAPAGVEVHWLVKAERQRIVDGRDELSFPVEQDKLIIGPRLPAN